MPSSTAASPLGQRTVGGLGGRYGRLDHGHAGDVSLPTGWVAVEVEVSDFDERACALLRNASNDKRVLLGSRRRGFARQRRWSDLRQPPLATPVHLLSDVLDVHTDSFELDRQPWDIKLSRRRESTTSISLVSAPTGLVKCWNTNHAFLDWGETLDSVNEMGENLPSSISGRCTPRLTQFFYTAKTCACWRTEPSPVGAIPPVPVWFQRAGVRYRTGECGRDAVVAWSGQEPPAVC